MATLAPLDLQTALGPLGLTMLGYCATLPADNLATGTIHLIGPDEPAFWPIFQACPEANDEAPDPLDRWSKRVMTDVAAQCGGTALFPFGGPTFQPFFTWALRSERFWASPIGFLVHDTAGLFVSFRGAILLPDILPHSPGVKPCDTCAGTPCKTACPVGAFDDGYDVAVCKSHITAPAGQDCLLPGCRARRICPVGQGNRLPAQAAFHMKAFV